MELKKIMNGMGSFLKKDNEWNGEFFKRSVVYNPDRLDFTLPPNDPKERYFDPCAEIAKDLLKMGIGYKQLKFEYDSNGIPRVTVLAPGSISNCEIEVTVKLDEETEETTHTFSAELPDGQIVTLSSPGADWTKGDTETFKRGDMRWKGLKNKTRHQDGYYIGKTQGLVGKVKIHRIYTESGACWLYEMLQVDTPILSITTWTRPVVAPEPIKEQEPPYYCPSREPSIGLEVWPENGRPLRVIK
jgi:hypothetical protein